MDSFDIDLGIKAIPRDPRKWLQKYDFTRVVPGIASAIAQGGMTAATSTADAGFTTFTGKTVEAFFQIGKTPPDRRHAAFVLGVEAALNAYKEGLDEGWVDASVLPGSEVAAIIHEIPWSAYGNPRKIEFLSEINKLINVTRFEDYFVRAISKAIIENRQIYIGLEAYFSYWMAWGLKAQKWIDHDNSRIQEVNESLLGEKCTLRQLFVKPLVYRIDNPERIFDLWVHIIPQWIESTDKSDCMRLIYGGPGAGKSSLTKMLSADLLQGFLHTKLRCRVVRIPIVELGKPINGTWDIASLRDRLNELYDFPFEIDTNGTLPLDGADRLVMIFDGLDELQVLGGKGADDAIALIESIRRLISDTNAKYRRLLAIVTGRDLVMEAVSEAAGDNKRKYHLHIYPTERLNLPGERDPLNEWWKNYQQYAEGIASPKGVPRALVYRKELHAILAEPLLNFLLARALKRGIDPKTVSLNVLYAQFLEDVYERVWELPVSEAHDRAQHARGFSLLQFQRVLSAVGVEIWHEGGIRAKKTLIEERCRNEKIVEAWGEVSERCTRDVGKLLMAFYLRHYSQDDSYGLESVEFTHKSFGEYLTALRIIQEIREVTNESDAKLALVSWIKLFGRQSMWVNDASIIRFVEDEIKGQGIEVVTSWQKGLTRLAEYTIEFGMPVDLMTSECRYSFRVEQDYVKNSEEALLGIIGACWCVTKKSSQISAWPPNTHYPQAWLNRLRGSILPTNWSGLRLCLQGLISLGANLTEAQLNGVSLIGVDLAEANLTHANLIGVDFRRANLQHANLREANVFGAKFMEANLKEAYITEAVSWSPKKGIYCALTDLANDEPEALPEGLSEAVILRLKARLNPQ